MPTTGVVNGTNLRLFVDGSPVGTATSCNLSFSKELRQTIHKDNVSGFAANESGTKSYTISFEGFVSEEVLLNAVAVKGLGDLYGLFAQDAAFTWRFSTDVTGDSEWSGNAIMNEFSISAPVEENSTVSGSLTGTGSATYSTIV